MNRADELLNDFNNILKKWQKALDSPKNEINRDAAILRFELAFEVGWKTVQHLVREAGYEAKSPRQAFQQAFSMGWITDEIIWDDILKARNTATHVYREAYAKALYDQLNNFHQAFEELKNNIERD